MATAPNERRQSSRASTGFPVELISNKKTRLGFTRNASDGGVLCFSRGAFPVGESIVLRFRDPRRPGTYLRVSGRVVRCRREHNTDVWAHELAVSLDQPMRDVG